MFESFRQSLSDLMDRATPPEERRAGLARMKQTLVQAKMGLDDLRQGVAVTRQRLEVELRELETMRRRKGAAAGINDAETTGLAEKYEAIHEERSGVLKRKLEAQEAELILVEREVSRALARLVSTKVHALRRTRFSTMAGMSLRKSTHWGARAHGRRARQMQNDNSPS
jgi:hypothetical protein